MQLRFFMFRISEKKNQELKAVRRRRGEGGGGGEEELWKMYPHPNDDIIAILYTLQFFISSVRSLLRLPSSFYFLFFLVSA